MKTQAYKQKRNFSAGDTNRRQNQEEVNKNPVDILQENQDLNKLETQQVTLTRKRS